MIIDHKSHKVEANKLEGHQADARSDTTLGLVLDAFLGGASNATSLLVVFTVVRALCLCILIVIIASISFHRTAQAADTTTIPQRIVSLGPGVTKKLFLLGAGDKVVANTTYCTYPKGAESKEKIGNVTLVNIEKILSLKPDLVLAIGLTPPRQVEKMRKLGLRVVRFYRPESFFMLCKDFIRLGELIGCPEKAETIIHQAKQGVAAVQKRVAALSKKRVFVQIGVKPLFTATRNTLVNDYIRLSGGENIADHEGSGVYSREKVLNADPEFIFVTTMGTSGDSRKKAQEKEAWLKYPSLKATKHHNIHVLNSDQVCSPTPGEFVEMLTYMASIIHPEEGA